MRPEREKREVRPKPAWAARPRRIDATPLVILAGVAVAAVTVFGAWTLLAGGIDINLDFETFKSSEEDQTQAEAAPTSAPTQAVTPSPTPGLPAVNGSPLSLTKLETAWKAKGLTMFSEGGAGGFGGMSLTPAAVRAQKGADQARMAVLVYPNSNAVKQ